MEINDEGLRLLSNMAGRYDAWVQAARATAQGHLRWRLSDGREYLYRIRDRAGNAVSLGPRTAETEAQLAAYETARETETRTWEQLRVEGRIYRSLRLPRIPSYGADVLRQLDLDQLLGTSVLVVGTNALTAYAIEAAYLTPPELDTTEDFDLSWVGRPPASRSTAETSHTVFGALKDVDSTYTINTERSFQARNANGNEVELLIAPHLASTLPRWEKLRPIPLPEQDWLLPGQRISHVVCGQDGLPARVIAPDPRWFGLHKLWLADKPTRDPLKRKKDRAQGHFVLDLVATRMPHYSLDDAFSATLPPDLLPYFELWQGTRLGTQQQLDEDDPARVDNGWRVR